MLRFILNGLKLEEYDHSHCVADDFGAHRLLNTPCWKLWGHGAMGPHKTCHLNILLTPQIVFVYHLMKSFTQKLVHLLGNKPVFSWIGVIFNKYLFVLLLQRILYSCSYL